MKSKLEPAKITLQCTVEFDTEVQKYKSIVKCLIKYQEMKGGWRAFPYILLSPETQVLGGYLDTRRKRYGDFYEFSQECHSESFENAVDFCRETAEEVKETLQKVAKDNKEKDSSAYFDREDFVIE